MSRFSDAEFDQAVAALEAAPFEKEKWQESLQLFSKAVGGWASQLVGVAPDGVVRFDLASGLSPDAVTEWERIGGGIPEVNPRAKVLDSLVNSITTDADYVTEQVRARSPMYQDFYRTFNADHAIMLRLPDLGNIRPAIVGLRGRTQGAADAAAMLAVRRLTPHIRSALVVAGRMSERDLTIRLSGFAEMSMSAIICSDQATVVGATPRAEEALFQGDLLTIKAGKLTAADQRSCELLISCIAKATERFHASRGKLRHSVIAARRLDGSTVRLDIAPISSDLSSTRYGNCCIIVVSEAKRSRDVHDRLRAVFRLSLAEAEIVSQLVDGKTAQQIAKDRYTSVETVRTQIRSAFTKLGISKATMLFSIVGPFLAGG